MRQLLNVLIMSIATAGMLAVTSADAARLGGGRSIGMKREATTSSAPKAPTAQPQPTPSQSPSAATAASAAPTPKPGGFSRWLGPLAAFGLGAALMSMFGGGAMMGAIGNILMIGLLIAAAFFVINMFRRKASPAATQHMQYAGIPPAAPTSPFTPASAATSSAEKHYPEGFDAEGFVRQAKVSFMRLQAANDAKDVRDIRDYTTPELYAELAMQIHERGSAAQKTDVVTLNAELVDVSVEPDRAIVSVRFTGLIREDEASGAMPVDEIWHVVKDLKDAKATWLVAGIAQNS